MDFPKALEMKAGWLRFQFAIWHDFLLGGGEISLGGDGLGGWVFVFFGQDLWILPPLENKHIKGKTSVWRCDVSPEWLGFLYKIPSNRERWTELPSRFWSKTLVNLHPWRLTWNVNITQLKRTIIFHPPPFLRVQNVNFSPFSRTQSLKEI